MKSLRLRALLSLLALLQAALPRANAEPIQWSYTDTVLTTGPSGSFGPQVLVGYIGNSTFLSPSYAQFAGASGQGTGSASALAYQMGVFPYGSFVSGHEGDFNQNVHTFNLTVGLTDAASGKSGSLIFHGGVDGFANRLLLATDASGTMLSFSHLNATFSSPTTQSVVLGNHLYKVSIDPVTINPSVRWPISPPGSWSPNTFSGYYAAGMQVQVSDVPEPSTLALAAVGLAGLGVRACRRRRCSPHRQPGP
jgi:MYXO-CTERM domain-containing protein